MVSKITRLKISGTTDSSGDATVYSKNFTGKVLVLQTDVNGLDAGADTTITSDGDLSAQTLLDLTDTNTNATYYPRIPAQDNAGSDVTFDGSNEIYTEFVVSGRLKAVIAQGGDTKDFVIWALVEEY